MVWNDLCARFERETERERERGRGEEERRWWGIKDVRGKNCEALCRIFNKAGSEEEED